jgi:predicted phosphodiesterase
MSQKIKYVIVPDVHSRDFWRKPVNKALSETDAVIIFLGDYVDPYPYEFCENGNFIHEHIKSWTDLSDYTVKTLSDIIDLKKSFPDRVILLLGNHDCGYMIGTHICSCRHERPKHSKMLETLFTENRVLFQLAYDDTINDVHYVFSHAGINRRYAWDCFFEEANENNVVELFNTAFKEDDYGIMESLGLYSFWRGAWRANYGSLIWADAREWLQGKEEAFGFSIVGHTQLSEHKIDGNFAFLDSRKCFSLKNDGKIEIFQ